MKIIFLDFDGVLNNYNFTESVDFNIPETVEETAFIDSLDLRDHRNRLSHRLIEPAAIKLLNSIIEATGAKVVLSTAWRNVFSMVDLAKMLKYQGFEGDIIDITPIKFSYVPREQEIKSWILDNKDLKYTFVILDDLPFAGEYYPDNFVNTDPDFGLTQADVEKAIIILNS